LTKKVWQWFVRSTFWGLLTVLRYVPWKPALASATVLGTMGYYLVGRYRRVALKNLQLAFGDEMTDRERQQLAKRVFQNFIRAGLVEFFKAATLPQDDIRKLVSVEQMKLVDEIIARGKGMILLTAHIGNWEMLARRAGVEGYRFAVVVRQNHDEGTNDITDFIRKSGGYDIIARGNSTREIIKRLRSGGIVAILPDQKSEDIFVPFFGRLTGTVAGPAVLALKTGAPITMMYCVHAADGSFVV
jgi:KDO2-lipid IV(A) lauroyltransferase